ncbi:MAG: peptidoglycan-binding domain-containing protein [Phycisphaerae bacterium]
MARIPGEPNIPGGGQRQQRAAQLKAEEEAKKRQQQAATGAQGENTASEEPLPGGGDATEYQRFPRHRQQQSEAQQQGEDSQDQTQLDQADQVQDQDEQQKGHGEAQKDAGTGPVGQGAWVVKEGDCISSIAKDTGHFWEKIWNDPANAELKEARKDPNVLLPGDRVTIPEVTPKQESGESEMRHRFVRRGEPEILRIRVLWAGQPRKNEPYALEVDGKMHSGVTDADGNIAHPIPGNARSGKLTVGGEESEQQEYDLMLGGIDPLEAVTGVQARLNNLGFSCGEVDGELGPRTRQTLKGFQAKYGLEETGRPDDATRQRLKREYGC